MYFHYRKARLQFTELLPEEIESNIQKDRSKDDAQKIEALLNLPRNPSSADKQDKDKTCSGLETQWRAEESYVTVCSMPVAWAADTCKHWHL